MPQAAGENLNVVTYNDVLANMKEIFEDLSEDLGLEAHEIRADEQILDLGMESISLVYLISELQQHYSLGNRVFEDMRAGDRLLKDMTVDDVIRSVLNVAR